jgi:predicted RNase H-like nuclease (RuvC/YqgF family)
MSRLLIVTLFFAAISSAFGQTKNADDAFEKIESLKKQNRALSSRLSESEREIFALKTKISALEQNTKDEIRKSQELQAQNERAMNIALDQFSVKFEEQNKLVAGVREELSKKFADQLVFSGLAFLALLIVFVILSRASTNKAMKQNVANWNSFQEHILKK